MTLPVKNAQQSTLKSLWHDERQSVSLGCLACHNIKLCGGMRTTAELFSCRYLCRCRPEEPCNRVCPTRTASYVRYMKEVNGFELDNVPRAPIVPLAELPSSAVMVYDRTRRSQSLECRCVALPLARLFSRRTGQPKYRSRAELASAFLIDPASQIVISGVDTDRPLECYWRFARSAGFAASLAAIVPTLVTAPNFSLFPDVPREDNFHNMKRIAICWQELTAAGIPTALHVNARTDTDWSRWTDFIGQRPEVIAIAFEFATGARFADRGEWYVEQLCKLRHAIGRELLLVVRGQQHVEALQQAFARITVIDTSIYVKSMKRQKVHGHHQGTRKWTRTMTLFEEPLDRVIQQNVRGSQITSTNTFGKGECVTA